MMNRLIRDEESGDTESISRVVRAAFGDRDGEPELVRLLRERREVLISLVAIEGSDLVGHVMISMIELETAARLRFGGLAPLSVTPSMQSVGIGSLLMSTVIARSRDLGLDALFLLGNPAYYSRFGFGSSHIGNEYGATDAFMHLELSPGCLSGLAGTARYASAFQDTDT